MFALADINSFYASCEKVFRPDLRNEPVIVLSNNDGCVIARSPEAKALGIRMGQPWFQVRQMRLESKRLARTVLIFTERSDQLSRATDRVPGLPASPGYAQ